MMGNRNASFDADGKSMSVKKKRNGKYLLRLKDPDQNLNLRILIDPDQNPAGGLQMEMFMSACKYAYKYAEHLQGR